MSKIDPSLNCWSQYRNCARCKPSLVSLSGFLVECSLRYFYLLIVLLGANRNLGLARSTERCILISDCSTRLQPDVRSVLYAVHLPLSPIYRLNSFSITSTSLFRLSSARPSFSEGSVTAKRTRRRPHYRQEALTSRSAPAELVEMFVLFDMFSFTHQNEARMPAIATRRKDFSTNASHLVHPRVFFIVRYLVDPGAHNLLSRFEFCLVNHD
jgi:hypothetical protein